MAPVLFSTYIAGLSYYNTTQVKPGPVQFEWEPTNKYDPHAIKVIQSGIHIGYVPRNMTIHIHKKCVGSIKKASPSDIGYERYGGWVLVIEQPTIQIFNILRNIYRGIAGDKS